MKPEVTVLYRDYGPADLAPLLERHGIDQTILVQAAPTEAETQFLARHRRHDAFVAGVVGWAEFSDREAPARIARLADDRLLVGLGRWCRTSRTTTGSCGRILRRPSARFSHTASSSTRC